jgi:hypothetical protein
VSLWLLPRILLLGVLGGCGGDLLPGELVVPGERSARSYRGVEGAFLGAGVALADGTLLAGAPGLGQVWRPGAGTISQGAQGLGRWVWWDGEQPMAAAADDGVYGVSSDQAELRWETPGAVSFAAGTLQGTTHLASATASDVQLYDAQGVLVDQLVMEGVQRLALGRERVLLIACDAGFCDALAWYPGGTAPELLGQAGDGGAVVESDGVAWWGNPQLEDAMATGWVCSELGDCIEGLEGDHLGRSLSATHAAGVFNTWLVPARLRLVPLGGGAVLAVDRGPPSRAPSLHSQGGSLAIGLPSDGVHNRGEGRVLVVELEG